jgi:hypothetical protein
MSYQSEKTGKQLQLTIELLVTIKLTNKLRHVQRVSSNSSYVDQETEM